MKTIRSQSSKMRAAGATVLATATLVTGLPGVSFAGPAEPGEFTTKVIIKNHTDLLMTLIHSQVTYGEWTSSPPEEISADGVGRMETASTDEEGGTGGTVTYLTSEGSVTVYWNDPDTRTDNEFTCDAPSTLTCTATGSPRGRKPVANIDIYD
ncbi:hypothetical protein [Actinoplanes subglobosus]|uniref:Crystal protein ET79 n=1 Tax=Actinoplanes subglobosus TaxID=1547892 RepID=A0ABV8ITR7_9ACTN